MRSGFLRIRFGKDKPKVWTVDEALADFRKRLAEQEDWPQASKPERTEPKAAATASTPNAPAASEPHVAGAISRPPQPKDFGVTPEQVAAYRPPDPEGYWSFGFFLFSMLIFGLPVLLFINALFDWQGSTVFLVGAFVFWCMLRLSRCDPLPADTRTRIKAYLHANAEYEQVLKEAELAQRRRQEDYWRSLSARGFEEELARLYRLAGYAVETTPVTGDQGADLFLRKDGQLIVVQCKRHGKPVGPPTVRELHGTLLHFSANRAVLAATGSFTKGARQHAQGKPIDLLDLDGILSLQETVTQSKTTKSR
jgi:hypothetical protein